MPDDETQEDPVDAQLPAAKNKQADEAKSEDKTADEDDDNG